ncbi:hypothetical protein ACFLRY_02975 [Bacteroidota bacterium]
MSKFVDEVKTVGCYLVKFISNGLYKEIYYNQIQTGDFESYFLLMGYSRK